MVVNNKGSIKDVEVKLVREELIFYDADEDKLCRGVIISNKLEDNKR